MTLGASKITIRSAHGNNSGWLYGGSNKTLNAGTSHIIFTGQITTSTHTTFTGNDNDEYYNISYTNPNSTEAAFYGNVKAHKVTFFGSSRFRGEKEIDSLILSSSKRYLFYTNQTIKINKYFKAVSSSCDGLIAIGSWISTGATPSNPSKLSFDPAAIIDINGTIISRVNAISGNITALNSIDNDNNTNITFPVPSGTTLYWVGGKGNWNDKAHWSLNNDGIFPASSGGCVPTPIDDVVFNNNSGFSAATDSVILDGIIHYCKDILWQGAKSNSILFGADSKYLNVYGSFTLQPNMRYHVARTNFISNHLGQTITTNKVTIGGPSLLSIGGNITFTGKGSWILQDSLTTLDKGSITLHSGTLNTNGKAVNIYLFSSNNNEVRKLELGASTITIRHSAAEWVYIGNNRTLDAGTSHIILESYQNSLNNLHFQGGNGNQYYNISFTNPSSLRAGINGSLKINKLFYAGNGNITGTNSIDTLQFTAGRTYEFEAGQIQTINKIFYPSGNPCYVTNIQSSSSNQAIARVLGGNVNYNYVSMKGVNATNSYATWNFGNQSTDGGNNSGVNFAGYDPNATIAGLGASDVFISTCNPFKDTLINTAGFYPNPTTSFSWSDGSTGDDLLITSSGTYSVDVNYGEGCTVSSSITIACPLPIELTNFEVIKNDHCEVMVHWTTGSERDNKEFKVYRSVDLVNWELIGVVEGRGNSSVANSYQLKDNTINESGTYYYYLRQEDYNGDSESFSPKSIVLLNCLNDLTVYPNPANEMINIAINDNGASSAGDIYFVDVAGKAVLQEKVEFSKDQQHVKINVSQLPAGIYMLQFASEERLYPVHKLVITR